MNHMKWVARWALACALVLPGAAHAGAYEDFFAAIKADDARAIEALLLRGISTNSADRVLGPAIVLAAKEKAWGALRALLISPATDINARNAQGETAMMYAALHGELAVAKLLLSRGAELNHPGWTPLHYAASSGQVSLTEWLLEQSAYIDAPSENGTTPLMMAARQEQLTVMNLLLKEGADPALRNDAGLTAADYLARRGQDAEAAKMRARADDFTRRYGTRDNPVPAPQR